jgi:hypothetical protein
MLRCLQCNGSLLKNEVACFTCGAPAVKCISNKELFRRRFCKVADIAFYFCVVLTVASLVTDYVPSFIKCLAATVILLFVRSSATQMRDSSQT